MKEIQLTRGKIAILDDRDFESLSKIKWHLKVGTTKKEYAAMSINRKPYAMHTFIMNPPKGYCVDHINGDGLDNRRINLRICSQGQNNSNRKMAKNNKSGFKGVSCLKRSKRFLATISIKGRNKEIGSYQDPKEAAKAYDEEAEKQYGEFALTNRMLGLIN